jgi:hypothetical protein
LAGIEHAAAIEEEVELVARKLVMLLAFLAELYFDPNGEGFIAIAIAMEESAMEFQLIANEEVPGVDPTGFVGVDYGPAFDSF